MTACIVRTRGDDVVVLQDTLVSRRLRNGAVRPLAEMRKFHLVADGGMVLCGAGPLAPSRPPPPSSRGSAPATPPPRRAWHRCSSTPTPPSASARPGTSFSGAGRAAASLAPKRSPPQKTSIPGGIPRHAIRANIPLNAALVEAAFRREARPWDFAGEIWALPAALRDGIGGEIECCIVSRDGIRITPMMRAFWSNGRRRRMPQRGVPAPSAPARERPPEDPVFFS